MPDDDLEPIPLVDTEPEPHPEWYWAIPRRWRPWILFAVVYAVATAVLGTVVAFVAALT